MNKKLTEIINCDGRDIDGCNDCGLSFTCNCVHETLLTNHPDPYCAQWLMDNEPELHAVICDMVE